jgi:tetratricopeptide (TPR) repeat protein
MHRPSGPNVRDAHNLYVETLAELGPVGLALLVAALALPLSAALRVRSDPLAPAALAAYVGFLVHASWDWDWELPAVTLSALFCALSLLVLARRDSSLRTLSPRFRIAAVGALLVPAAFAFVALVGNSALSESARALEHGNVARSTAQARKAERWAPWSPEPWRRLALARIAADEDTGAVAAYRRAIANDPTDWRLWFELAYARPGRVDETALARARVLNPLNPDLRRR